MTSNSRVATIRMLDFLGLLVAVVLTATTLFWSFGVTSALVGESAGLGWRGGLLNGVGLLPASAAWIFGRLLLRVESPFDDPVARRWRVSTQSGLRLLAAVLLAISIGAVAFIEYLTQT
ncbi:MAG: hypothetical protein AAFM91_15260 [Pseudomonadota bacterium]